MAFVDKNFIFCFFLGESRKRMKEMSGIDVLSEKNYKEIKSKPLEKEKG